MSNFLHWKKNGIQLRSITIYYKCLFKQSRNVKTIKNHIGMTRLVRLPRPPRHLQRLSRISPVIISYLLLPTSTASVLEAFSLSHTLSLSLSLSLSLYLSLSLSLSHSFFLSSPPFLHEFCMPTFCIFLFLCLSVSLSCMHVKWIKWSL